MISNTDRALAEGFAGPEPFEPELRQYRVEADWHGGGFGYTKSFASAEQARAWGEAKARFYPDAVVTVQDRTQHELQRRQQHRALEQQVNRPDDLSLILRGDRT